MTKAYFNWSTGKDSAMALYQCLQDKELTISGLLTTINEGYDRVSMHGIRRSLLHKQAESIGLPLFEVLLPEVPTMESYELALRSQLDERIKQGDTISIFGDIFLEDLRKYREDKLAEIGLKAHFPLWKKDTNTLARELIDLGFKAIVVCVNEAYLDDSYLGRLIDHDFIDSLPTNVDPCGENGEYHTFVFDGPIFKEPIPFELGEKVYRTYQVAKQKEDDTTYDCATENEITTGFWYLDLM